MVVGLLIYTAGLFGLSYSTSYAEIFLAQGVACGVSLLLFAGHSLFKGSDPPLRCQLASGILFLPACSAVSHFFKKKRSLALGFLATGR